MRHIFTFTFLFLWKFGFSQDSIDGKKVYVKEVDWQITIPKVFDTVSSTYMEKMSAKGRKMITDATKIEVEPNNKNLFTYRNKFVNYIIAEYQYFNPAKDGNYTGSCREVYKVAYETFKHQYPDKNIDTSYEVETIDGLQFLRYSIKITLGDNSQMSFYLFNHLFGKKDLTVSIVYLSLLEGALILDAMRKSKFGIR